MDIDRDEYLDTEVGVLPPDPNKLIPEWLQREAGLEEDWEKVEKRRLEVGAFARDFKRAFPDEVFAGVYSQYRATGVKKMVKTPDDVLDECYSWIDKKTKGEATKAKDILVATGLANEYITGILTRFKDAVTEKTQAASDKLQNEYSKLDSFSGMPSRPSDALSEVEPGQTTAEEVSLDDRTKALERKKVVAGYGIIANDKTVSLFKRGKLLKEIDTEAFGGFAVIAEEMKSLETAPDVEALFDVKSTGPDSDKAPIYNVAVGNTVAWKTANGSLTGEVLLLDGSNATVRLANYPDTQVAVPLSALKVL